METQEHTTLIHMQQIPPVEVRQQTGCSKKSSPYICCESLRLAMEFVFQNDFFKNAIISDKFI